MYDCSCGHNSNLLVQKEKFELLYDMGIICIKKGFYKEAVSDLASSLERFLEYVIRYILIDTGKQYDDISKVWKSVKNQSERQYGAFLYLFFNQFDEIKNINEKQVKFRNSVIHQGTFPTESETKEYAKYVFNYITDILNILDVEIVEGGLKVSKLFKAQKIIYEQNPLHAEYNRHVSFIDIIRKSYKNMDFESIYDTFYQDNTLDVYYG